MSISNAKMASVKEKDSKVADAELSFLDLKDCSLETRTYLLALLEDESKPKTPPVQATSVTPSAPSISSSSEAEATSVTQAQQQQPAQHHFQQVRIVKSFFYLSCLNHLHRMLRWIFSQYF